MVECMPVFGSMEENCYFYIDETTGQGVLIDPGAEASRILEHIRAKGWVVEKILLTHGHFDHIGAVQDLKKELHMPVYAYETSNLYLTNPMLNLSAFHRPEIMIEGVRLLQDGETVTVPEAPGLHLQVIYTPGHTSDSVLFWDERQGLAFVGDTIFRAGIGNDRLPGGDGKALRESIVSRIFTLPDATVLYPGHGDCTTVGEEKRRYGFS